MINKEIYELRREFDNNEEIKYKTDDLNALEALLEEAKGTDKMPIKWRYLEELRPFTYYKFEPTPEYIAAVEQREHQFEVDFDKYVQGTEDYDKKHTFYAIAWLPSMKILKEIDGDLIDTLRFKDNQRFEEKVFFGKILTHLNRLDSRIAKDRINNFNNDISKLRKLINAYEEEKKKSKTKIIIAGETKKQESHNENKFHSVVKTVTDAEDSIVLIFRLIDFLETKYLPQKKETDRDAEESPGTIDSDTLTKLINKNLIDPESHKWKGSNVLCAYFVNSYFNHLPNKWEVAKQIFGIENLAQSKDGYENSKTGKPRNHQIIDEILNPED